MATHNASVTLDQAQIIIGAARAKADDIGVPMNIAVVDAGNNLTAFSRMDGAWLGSIVTIFATYVFGDYPIEWWLQTSVSRTTIFAQVLLYADICIWLVVALVGASGRGIDLARTTASPAARPDAAGDATGPVTSSPATRL